MDNNSVTRGRGRPRKDPSQPKDASAVLDALKRFDSLPDSAFVSEPVVSGLIGGKSRQTVYNWQRTGLIPKSYKIGYSTVWNVGELRIALAAIIGKGGHHASAS